MLQELDEGSVEYKIFFADNPSAMWILEADTQRFVDVNMAAIEQYGYTREEFLSMTLADIRAASDNSYVFNLIRNREEASFRNVGISSHRKRNGDILYVQVYARHLVRNSKKMSLAMLVDQTDRINCEQKNMELGDLVSVQGKRLDYILANIDDVVWATWADTQELIFTNNNACEKVYGYSEAEMLADKGLFFNLILPEDKPSFFDSSNRLLTTGRADFDFRVRHKDGSIKYLRGLATVMKGENGEPDVCCGLNIDVTREKELLSQIEESEQKLRALIDNSGDLIWSVNKDFTLGAANQAYKDFVAKFTGSVPQPGDCIFYTAFGVDMINRWKSHYSRALNGEGFIVSEELVIDGKLVQGEIRFSPILDKNNNITGTSCFSRTPLA